MEKGEVSLTLDELKEAAECGIINVAYVREQMDMTKRKEFLKMHPYSVWQGRNGNWYTYLPKEGEERSQIKRKTRESLEDVIVNFWKEKSYSPTIREVFEESNNEQLELKLIGLDTHKRYQQEFNRFFTKFGEKKIRDICAEDCISFLEHQIAEFELTFKAYSNLRTVLSSTLIYAKRNGYIRFGVKDLFDAVRTGACKQVVKEDYEEVFDEEETELLANYLEDNLDIRNAGLLLLLQSGIRVGELVTLKSSDISGTSINIRRTESRQPKDGGSDYVVKDFPKSKAGFRTVVVSEDYRWLCDLLKEYNPNGEYVFVNEKGERLTTNAIRRRAERVCRKLGIYQRSPHKYRKTFITILLDNKVDERTVKDLAGHEQIETSERDYHRNRKTIERKTEIISEIPDFQRNKNNHPTKIIRK